MAFARINLDPVIHVSLGIRTERDVIDYSLVPSSCCGREEKRGKMSLYLRICWIDGIRDSGVVMTFLLCL
jgi:hypothetical protein